MTTYDGQGKAAGRLVTRDDAAEALRVLRMKEERAPHSEAAMQTIVALYDRVAELEAANDVMGGKWCAQNRAEGRSGCGACAWCCKQQKDRADNLDSANARLTEERDNLKDAIGYLQIQVREANQKLLDLRTALRAQP